MQEWHMARRLRPGYRALFHGPPGTEETNDCVVARQGHGA
jgi:hypothetical protein